MRKSRTKSDYAAALGKPVKSASIPAAPTYDISGEPKIYTPDPDPHPLVTLAREEALPRITTKLDELLQGKSTGTPVPSISAQTVVPSETRRTKQSKPRGRSKSPHTRELEAALAPYIKQNEAEQITAWLQIIQLAGVKFRSTPADIAIEYIDAYANTAYRNTIRKRLKKILGPLFLSA